MRFCKLIPLDTFSIIQSLSGNPPTLHYPHRSTALTLQATDSPRGGKQKSLASTQRGLHTGRPLRALYQYLLLKGGGAGESINDTNSCHQTSDVPMRLTRRQQERQGHFPSMPGKGQIH